MGSRLLVFFVTIMFVLVGCNKEEDLIVPTDTSQQKQTITTTSITSNNGNVAPTPDLQNRSEQIAPSPSQQTDSVLPKAEAPTPSEIMPMNDNEATPLPSQNSAVPDTSAYPNNDNQPIISTPIMTDDGKSIETADDY